MSVVWLWLALVAFAAEPTSSQEAEARRLSAELARLEQRGAWAGAEAAYRDLVATGQPLSRSDHVLGAHASRALGDVTATVERVRAAAALGPDQEVDDWLAELESAYGRVRLSRAADSAPLTPAAMPFQTDRASAVRFAIAALDEAMVFEGFLPAGRYTLGDVPFEVRPAKRPVVVALGEPPRPPAPRAPLVGVLLGTGSPYGAPVGPGALVVVRPLRWVGVSVGGGYDPAWGSPGFAAGVRAYPASMVHLGAGYGPVAGDGAAGERVLAHGPQGAAGVDLAFGPLRVDATLGVGIGWSGGRQFTATTASVGAGVSLGRSK